MEKPELKDYDLTEEKFAINKEQNKVYMNKMEQFFVAKQQRNKMVKKWVWSIAIVSFILFLIFAGLANNGGGSIYTVLGIVFLLSTIISPVFISKVYSLEDLPISEYDKRKEIEFARKIGFNVNRSSYVDQEIENKIIKYNNDLKRYEDYREKLTLEFWNNLSGYQFEKEVANLYKQLGYNAKVTQYAADAGIDIILTKNNETIAVQCKHHQTKVGPNEVRALQGVVYNGNYTSGIFVSLNGFTPTVPSEVARGKIKIELVSIKDIISMQKQIENN